MKTASLLTSIALGCLLLFAGGCAVNRPVLQRGWIGGSFHEARATCFRTYEGTAQEVPGITLSLAPAVAEKQRSAIFVSRIFDGTPAQQAGILPGDIILGLNGAAVKNMKAFYAAIRKSEPGSPLRLTLYRNGALQEVEVKTGRESYKKEKSISIGIGLSAELDIIPNPDFNILNLIYYRRDNSVVELHSPEFEYQAATLRAQSPQSDPLMDANGERWDMMLGIFGCGGRNRILSQETVQ